MVEVFSLPVSTSLLAEVNAVGMPSRNKAQDGTVGDTAHEDRVSDHNRDETGNTGSSSDPDNINEVHARDVDARGPWLIKGGAERIVQLIVANVRAIGHAKRRVKYVIFKRRIWKWINGEFVQRVYDGTDPHDLHFHVSFEYGSGSGASNPENNTASWGILAAYRQEQQNMDLTQENLDDIAKAVWEFQVVNPYLTAPNNKQPAQTPLRYAPSMTPHQTTQAKVDKVMSTATQTLALVTELAGKDFTDEAAIVQGVLAGLASADGAAQTIADAVVNALPTDLAQEVVAEMGRLLSTEAEQPE